MPFIEHNGRRVLFIHIPKAGGTSVEAWMKTIAPLRLFSMGIPAISRCTPQHYRAQDIRNLLGEGYFDYIFTIVRNPYERIESEYRMRAQLAKESFWKGLPDFSPWLEMHLEQQKRDKFVLDNHLRPQWEFVSNDVEVFHMEEGLEAPLAKVAGILEVDPPKQPPHELKSKRRKITWDHVDRIRVQEHYARDFTQFEYEP
ncbi:hypothetical protein GG851_25570 [Bordetella petrii]|nr:hypothetical protein [Bordetella petrii]